MQHEHDAQNAVDVADAVLRAKDGDRVRAAFGLAMFSREMLDDEAEQADRTALALAFYCWACELDPDLFVALKWH